ncbi:succinate-semialdehyde dehydrogenase [Actibacterium pelagium]|uniref:Succinate-semialdehyde dehydrogenase n=2 Tax=Actibacterium pelagium TaxID=2029103 RepID=A0A917EGG3_9RHOB|nr:succinate-semialdehyde dehydrogenase [Actibacterium pelagium]
MDVQAMTTKGLLQNGLTLLSGGRWIEGEGGKSVVLDKFRLEPIAEARGATPQQVAAMIDAAHAAFKAGAPSPYERGAILDRAARIIEEKAEEVARVVQAESGFTANDAHGEVSRCIQTMKLSAEEARRLRGEVVPLSGAPGQDGRVAFTMRVPLGVVLAITPFNSPLNTVAHKLAPAFAAGNAVIAKPSSATPMTTVKLAEILIEAGMPAGFLSVLLGGGAIAQAAIEDERVRFIAFTGSTGVGRKIQQAAGLRRTQMELGSIAFTVVCDDADFNLALPKIVGASYRKAGQVCTSVQMALIHASRFDEAAEKLAERVRAVPYGDPANPDTYTGPLINEDEAKRVADWIDEAIAMGAARLVGGPREGAVVPPTLLTNVTPEMKVCSEEIFGPVLCLQPFETEEEAIERVNSTPFGLATGVFTNSLDRAFGFARKLEVGGVHINETSSSRVDLMPYGGSKDSGFGREGPYYAVHEMTEDRIITFTA